MMLGGDSEKMVFLSSTTTTNNNEWQQNFIDEKGNLMASTAMVMEKSNQDQEQQKQQQQQQQLKCPRCDSSNTKFCYYNNYSLTQPRHFCKACKRYWTRGGTLRNVPVGGGNRRNKRVKRSSAIVNNQASLSSSAITAAQNPSVQSHVDLSSSSSIQINPLFYGLPSNPSEMNLPYPRFNEVSGYDFQSQLNVLGLGFSSSGLMGSEINNDNYRNGFDSSKRIEDVVTSNPYPILGSSSSNSTSTLASLIASSLQHQKFISNGFKDMQGDNNNFQGLLPFENLQMERGSNRLNWDIHNQNQIEHMNSSDPSLWNTSGVGAWLDPSLTSLI